MKNKTINNIVTALDRNLPTILTGVSVVSGLFTTGYAVYAGFKTREDLDDISDDEKLLEKIRILGPRFVPVLLGATMSAGCAIAANHEHGKRYAALAATLAATRIDTAKVQAKAEELLGKEKVKEVEYSIRDADDDEEAKKAYARLMANAEDRVLFRDLETGYIFRTNLHDFLFAQRRFNEKIDNSGEASIADFYGSLLKDDYVEANTHNDVVFGKHTDSKYFNPDLDVELGPDMQPVYMISYKYATSTIQIYD